MNSAKTMQHYVEIGSVFFSVINHGVLTVEKNLDKLCIYIYQ